MVTFLKLRKNTRLWLRETLSLLRKSSRAKLLIWSWKWPKYMRFYWFDMFFYISRMLIMWPLGVKRGHKAFFRIFIRHFQLRCYLKRARWKLISKKSQTLLWWSKNNKFCRKFCLPDRVHFSTLLTASVFRKSIVVSNKRWKMIKIKFCFFFIRMDPLELQVAEIELLESSFPDELKIESPDNFEELKEKIEQVAWKYQFFFLSKAIRVALL